MQNLINSNGSKMKYVDNKNRKVYNIDFDGTLTDGSSYENLIPNPKMVKKVRELYFAGHIIIIWSARQWSNANTIVAWLIQNDVSFHGIMLGKGGTDYYVDDKSVSINDFLKESF